MSNEKQQKILEMAKDICRVKLNCNDVCKPISACDALRYAERAVEAGYVKQKEGEWVEKGDTFYVFACSACGGTVDFKFQMTPYCPNCGAKMKGGE